MTRYAAALAAPLLLVGVLLTGCTGGDADEPTPTPSVEQTPAPSPSPTAPVPTTTPATDAPATDEPTTPTDDPSAALGCDSLLSEEERSRPLPDGVVLLEDYQQKVESENSALRLFFRYGGIACLWGYEGTDNVDVRAYSTLDATQSTEARAELESQGFTATPEAEGTVYRSPDGNVLGYDEAYVFTPDAWYYALDQAARDIVRAELVG